MIIGHIGVRAGSKGLAGKNMRMLAGKPLLQWSLDQLREHPRVDAVMVSTDCPDMYQFAREQGALDIGLRADALATDDASKWDVWRDSLQKAVGLGLAPDIFLDFDATAPLRRQVDVTNALDLFEREAPDMVMSCTIARKNPYFNLVEPDETGALQVSKPLPHAVVARQHAPLVYEHVGSLYVVSPSYLNRASFLYDGRVLPYVMAQQYCYDIDSMADFDYVEYLIKTGKAI